MVSVTATAVLRANLFNSRRRLLVSGCLLFSLSATRRWFYHPHVMLPPESDRSEVTPTCSFLALTVQTVAVTGWQHRQLLTPATTLSSRLVSKACSMAL